MKQPNVSRSVKKLVSVGLIEIEKKPATNGYQYNRYSFPLIDIDGVCTEYKKENKKEHDNTRDTGDSEIPF